VAREQPAAVPAAEGGAAPAVLPVGLCVSAGALAGSAQVGSGAVMPDCALHSQGYSLWHEVFTEADAALTQETDVVQSFWLGWDVGGAVTVDHTALFVAAWDARAPPGLLESARPGGRAAKDVAAEADVAGALANFEPDPALLAELEGRHGFAPAEARAFARRIFVLQLFREGALPVGDPAVAELSLLSSTASAPQGGGTRWAFGGGKAPVIARPALLDAGAPVSPVAGAPDLQHFPFETRFEACFSVRATALGAAATSALAPGSLEACDPNADVRAPETQRPGGSGTAPAATAPPHRALAFTSGAAAASPAAPADGGGARPRALDGARAAARTFVGIPFAAVDGDFARQDPEPEPAGMKPQTHWANARINPSWRKSNAGFRVRGRHHAAAAPIFLAVETRVRIAGEADPRPSPSRAPSASPSARPSASAEAPKALHQAQAQAAGAGMDATSAAVAAFFVAAASTVLVGGLVLAVRAARAAAGAAGEGAPPRLARWTPAGAPAATAGTVRPARAAQATRGAVEDEDEDEAEQLVR
jgi:hypothetical protein